MDNNIPEYRPVFRVLYRTMTIWGVERRLFFLALILGACTFNLFKSFLGGLLVWAVLYGAALQATSRDPQMLAILLRSGRYRPRYDTAKPSSFALEIQ
jgi:type IV secretory pathway TrbD component